MSRKHVQALVAYRLEQAEEAIRSAETLLATGLHRDSVNRSYYAMFYAVLALLVTQDIATSKHQGVIATFDREFVKKGVVWGVHVRPVQRDRDLEDLLPVAHIQGPPDTH